jgi:hypothetical protein
VDVDVVAPPAPPVPLVEVEESSEQPKATVAMIRKIVVVFMFPLNVNRAAVWYKNILQQISVNYTVRRLYIFRENH